MRSRLISLFFDVGANYQEKGVAVLQTLYSGHDVHVFYRLNSDPAKIIHVQGYPSMSSDKEAMVYARMMDYERMEEIRNNTSASIGNEHGAVTQNFPNFEAGITIPYDPKLLEAKLAENVPELA